MRFRYVRSDIIIRAARRSQALSAIWVTVLHVSRIWTKKEMILLLLLAAVLREQRDSACHGYGIN